MTVEYDRALAKAHLRVYERRRRMRRLAARRVARLCLRRFR